MMPGGGSDVSADESAVLGDCWDGQSRDVFLLGAGFSIAVSSEFPGTDELGNCVIERLKEQSRPSDDAIRFPTDGFEDGRFESWLARLAEDQPYLSTGENLRNRALFVELSNALRGVLIDCEERVEQATPSWLFDLVSVWHARRAQVITLNYDTLIERNVDQHLIADPGADRLVTSSDMLDGLPPTSAGTGAIVGVGLQTMRLLKLHGSTSWFWVPNDTTGSTIQRWGPLPGLKDAAPDVEADRGRTLPGREPFIVPPTTTKASFYNNPLTREIWTRSHKAIRHCDRLFLVGYSFPSTDVSVTGLVADALITRDTPAEVRIVDKNPEPIRARLESIGIHPAIEEPAQGCVERFVAGYVDESAKHVVEHLQRWNPTERVGTVRVAWGAEPDRFAMHWILDMNLDDASRTLSLQVVGPEEAPPTAIPPLLDRFLSLLDGAERIVIQADGAQSVIVGYRSVAQRRAIDGKTDLWLLSLNPTGLPPPGWIRQYPRIAPWGSRSGW